MRNILLAFLFGMALTAGFLFYQAAESEQDKRLDRIELYLTRPKPAPQAAPERGPIISPGELRV